MQRTRERISIDPAARPAAARGLILIAAFLSFCLSVGLFFLGDKQDGIFVAIWVPSILALGSLIAPPSGGTR